MPWRILEQSSLPLLVSVLRSSPAKTRTEVSDLEVRTIVVGDSVDGEMCVDQSHLVEESLCDTNDHVLDEGLDGS